MDLFGRSNEMSPRFDQYGCQSTGMVHKCLQPKSAVATLHLSHSKDSCIEGTRAAGLAQKRIDLRTKSSGDIFYEKPFAAERPPPEVGNGTSSPQSPRPMNDMTWPPKWKFHLHRGDVLDRIDASAAGMKTRSSLPVKHGTGEFSPLKSPAKSTPAKLTNAFEKSVACQSQRMFGCSLDVDSTIKRGSGSCSPNQPGYRDLQETSTARLQQRRLQCSHVGVSDISLATRKKVGSHSPLRDPTPRSPEIGGIAAPTRMEDGPTCDHNLLTSLARGENTTSPRRCQISRQRKAIDTILTKHGRKHAASRALHDGGLWSSCHREPSPRGNVRNLNPEAESRKVMTRLQKHGEVWTRSSGDVIKVSSDNIIDRESEEAKIPSWPIEPSPGKAPTKCLSPRRTTATKILPGEILAQYSPRSPRRSPCSSIDLEQSEHSIRFDDPVPKGMSSDGSSTPTTESGPDLDSEPTPPMSRMDLEHTPPDLASEHTPPDLYSEHTPLGRTRRSSSIAFDSETSTPHSGGRTRQDSTVTTCCSTPRRLSEDVEFIGVLEKLKEEIDLEKQFITSEEKVAISSTSFVWPGL